MNQMHIEMATINKMLKADRQTAKTLGDDEARFLVDAYYITQDARIRAAGQVRAMSASNEPHLVLQWLLDQNEALENEIKKALDIYSKNHLIGDWMRSITGIGPVIAAGFLAHIDIHKAPTVGHIWSFAGLINAPWNKGEKRPWNADLKRLCWLLGESFVKVSSNEKDFYGKIYKERKDLELANNEKGVYAGQAASKLETTKIGKDTDAYAAYSQGKLPPAHIHARAKRYAVKLFLSHLHHVWYVREFKVAPPNPYPIAHMGHVHHLLPPNFSDLN